jgi:hypothetical protein
MWLFLYPRAPAANNWQWDAHPYPAKPWQIIFPDFLLETGFSAL